MYIKLNQTYKERDQLDQTTYAKKRTLIADSDGVISVTPRDNPVPGHSSRNINREAFCISGANELATNANDASEE